MKVHNSALARPFLKVEKESKSHSPLGFYKSKGAGECVDSRMMSFTSKQFADQVQPLCKSSPLQEVCSCVELLRLGSSIPLKGITNNNSNNNSLLTCRALGS